MHQVLDPAFIDVRQLIQDLSDEELLQSADAYFASMTPASEQCRKPFSNPQDAIHLTRHLALVLQAAELFRGARVLDFGCATGWLTLGLADLGCEAEGVDISAHAVKLAEHLKQRRTRGQGSGGASFHVYDGKRLPFDDASLDRVICNDAFHHVRDQGATLAEFFRVLRPGGRAAFIEPGPHHSKTAQSQLEMARYKVIENDVVMADIAAHANALGFEPPRILVQFPQPFDIAFEQYAAWERGGIEKSWGQQAIAALSRQLVNGQCFYLHKPGGHADSRQAQGLAGTLRLVSAKRVERPGKGAGVQLEVEVCNSGSSVWLAGSLLGQVNVGVQVLSAEGHLIDNNLARLRLERLPVLPGEQVMASGVVPWPGEGGQALQLDLVAELVAWFGNLGQSSVLTVPLSSL